MDEGYLTENEFRKIHNYKDKPERTCISRITYDLKNIDYKKRLAISFCSFPNSLRKYTLLDGVSDFLSGILLGNSKIRLFYEKT